MSANKQLILLLLVMFFIVKGPFSSDVFTYYFIYSCFIAGCIYAIVFRKMYFVFRTPFSGDIKSILLLGWKAVLYGSIFLALAVFAGFYYSEFNREIFIRSLPLGFIIDFWVYKLIIKYREDKLKTV